jgi:hypothetical protein
MYEGIEDDGAGEDGANELLLLLLSLLLLLPVGARRCWCPPRDFIRSASRLTLRSSAALIALFSIRPALSNLVSTSEFIRILFFK